ncbi:MAG TPA: alpha/beta fold hydrolase [Gaiellaceae bacterium]|nr:alpha/beta fold hydrolase [Gaiellaceae bacterium]
MTAVAAASSDGVRIAYELRGEGEPLVLVHGLAYDRFGWGRLPDLLAERFRVVVLDNRGVGESDAPAGPYTVAQLAADVVAVLDDAGLDRVNLFGVSLGGYVAQELALTRPERLRRLVLCSTAPGGARAVPMPQATQEVFARYPTMEREAGLRMFVENSLGERGVRELPELVEEILRYRLEHAPSVDAWLAQAAAGATYDNSERVGSISVPTLVLHGGADVVVDPRNAGVLASSIPGACVEVVPDCGHLLVWEDSERVARLVTEFLA